ncbi:uncharacterized protein LOC116293713 isoform X3 [Actinia tenebrosa]|uniref:Uncharacterized protein LOC116293713 isoform X3 n=1 Tax=Actinia tenebrosa TaxID=6105 RepID=A0A6P8HPN4_ACTTE|nr:uncharacterized protein LOC116293713 isoform X3 [Actinia tenebrosa]
MDPRESPEVLISDGDGLLSMNTLIERSKAVCYIQVIVKDPMTNTDRLRRGSGFYSTVLINQIEYLGIFTNNHVLSNEIEAQQAEVIFDYDKSSYVNEQVKTVSLRPDLIFKTNKDLDYSFIGVQKENIEALHPGVNPIQFKPEPKISGGDEVFILQHPKGRPQEFSHDKIMTVMPPFVLYKADTETGSSGAPVFYKLNLVAIHQKGSEEQQYNKGVLCSEVLSHLNTGKYTKPTAFPIQDSQGEEIDKVSEGDLEELAKEIIPIWRHLGRKLGLDNSRIEEISKDYANLGIREQAFQMLLSWKESSPNPSYGVLGNALIILGKRNLAQRYCHM